MSVGETFLAAFVALELLYENWDKIVSNDELKKKPDEIDRDRPRTLAIYSAMTLLALSQSLVDCQYGIGGIPKDRLPPEGTAP